MNTTGQQLPNDTITPADSGIQAAFVSILAPLFHERFGCKPEQLSIKVYHVNF